MKSPVLTAILLIVPLSALTVNGQDVVSQRDELARAASGNPRNVNDQFTYAEFLDSYGDAGARAAYAQALSAAQAAGDKAHMASASMRLAGLDLLAGDREAATRDAAEYQTATGKALTIGTAAAVQQWAETTIPGPMRSFARMAAISPDSSPQEVLPALAHNIITNGYEASHGNEALEQTEYLKLVHRYLSQARELEKFAGDKRAIHVESCDAANVADLLRILGFRMRGGCGSEVVLETVNAARAFLTTDSGFPISQLEEALRTNHPFDYDYRPSRVPVLFTPEYWLGIEGQAKEASNFIEGFIGDPAICRLYLGFTKLDAETADAIRKADTYAHLRIYAHVLDFFGGMFEVRDGKAVVPGGQKSAAMWNELTGGNVDKGGDFFAKLIAKDDGWLCSQYDALARISGPVQEYLTDPARMKRFYTAVRGRVTSPGPARPVFRANTDMMLFTTRLQVINGKPHIPGSFDVWKTLFTNSPQGKYDGKLTRSAATWKDSDDVLEALFALSRKSVENEPLKIFMAITDIDRGREKPMTAATVDRLARMYHTYGAQYSILSDSRRLTDASIGQFLDTLEATTHIRDPLFRSDTAGTFQGLVGLWQILVRQGTISGANADAIFSGICTPFTGIKTNVQLFDAGRGGLMALMGGKATANPQQHMLDLLAGEGESEDAETRNTMEEDFVRIFDAQHIISLDTLLQLAAYFEGTAKGDKAAAVKLAAQIAETPIPRPPLTANERNALGFGYYSERHMDAERKMNLRLGIERAAADPAKLKELTGDLAPHLRDSLLAMNYAYFAPPGAQILYTNPVFVRSHDFIGGEGQSRTWAATETYGTGWPSNGGGRLVGSLCNLPYTLAEAEQNFLIPTHTQALIWGDLVPQMILSAKIPRWWAVTPAQMHWVALHVRYGRELLGEAALDSDLRGPVVQAIATIAAPARAGEIARRLADSDAKGAAELTTPAEMFALARIMGPGRDAAGSPMLAELRRMQGASPNDLNYAAVSRAFGSPKPTLSNSYEPEMLNLRTFPTLMGYSSRIMAESWESNAIYFAALADEIHLRPSQLNLKAPEWTQKLVEQIFASHLEDWPAVLKSLRSVGDGVRAAAKAPAAEKGLQ